MVSDFYQFNKGLLKSSPQGIKWFAYYEARWFQRFRRHFWDTQMCLKSPLGILWWIWSNTKYQWQSTISITQYISTKTLFILASWYQWSVKKTVTVLLTKSVNNALLKGNSVISADGVENTCSCPLLWFS